MDVERATQIVSLVVYSGLTVAAVRFWRAQGVPAARWLVATFGSLTAIVALGVFSAESSPAEGGSRWSADRLILDGVVFVLLAFPYLLHRFARSLRSRVTASGRLADAALAGLAVWTVLLPGLPAVGQRVPGWYQVYRAAFILFWLLVLVGTAVSLWRAGRGQPAVARSRMRSMAAATLALSVAVLIGSATNDSNRFGELSILITSLLSWLSAALFWAGFAPPSELRRLWRTEDEARLRRAAAGMASATTPQAAAELVIEPIGALLGGQSAVILDAAGTELARCGDGLADPQAEDPGRIVIDGGFCRLVVERSRLTPLFGEDEQLMLRSFGAYLDLCLERIAAFEASEAARRQAQQASEELQQLVYGISHDLKNPLHTVTGFLDLLRPEVSRLSDDGQMFLERIQVSTTYMARLIDDLLTLSRVGHTDAVAADVPLRTLVEEIGRDIGQRYPGVSVHCGGDVVLSINPVRARQLFTNLIENAARHGGRRPLAVQVHLGPRRGALAEVLVEDDGVGVPEQHREKVFAIFERLEGFSTSEGTGVGLAMCRRIVQDAGGSIDIVDSLVGARFRLLLPERRAVSTGRIPQMRGAHA